MAKNVNQLTVSGQSPSGDKPVDEAAGSNVAAQGPIINSVESSAVDAHLSPVEEAIQSDVDATSSSNVAGLQGRSMISLDFEEETVDAKQIPNTEMAIEKESQQGATAEEVQEGATAEKPEEPAKVAKEAEVEIMGKHDKMAYMPNNEQAKSDALSLEATQPNEMLAKAETEEAVVPQSSSAALGPVLPSATVVKVETNVVPQGEMEIFSIFAAQGPPIISTPMDQELDSSSDSDFEEVPSLPPLDEEEHSPKGSKRNHGEAKKEEPSPKKQKTQDGA